MCLFFQINSTLVLFALNETLKEQDDIRLGELKNYSLTRL